MYRRCQLAGMIATLFSMVGVGLHAAETMSRRPAQHEQEYWAQVDRKDWSGAAAAAEALVAAARQKAAKQPLDLGEALSLLGNAQLGAANFGAAESAFREALQLVEPRVGTTSERLFEPLRGLGYTLAATGRHEEAIPHLERALLVSHRSHGLFDIGQQGLLRRLADSHSSAGDVTQAERHLQYLRRVGESNYGARDPRMAPIYTSIGDWYADVGDFTNARNAYRIAIDTIERKLGANDLALIAPLRALARSYTQEVYYSSLGLARSRERIPTDADGTSNADSPINPRYIATDGERALERVLQIIESHADAPRELLAAALIQMGDWQQTKQQMRKALPFYQRAWTITGAKDRSAPVDTQLSFPVRVYYPTPRLASRNLRLPAEAVEQRFAEVEFTVAKDGTVRDVRLGEHDASERQAAELLEAIGASRYRPKFIDGEPVDTPAVTYREVFRIRRQSGD